MNEPDSSRTVPARQPGRPRSTSAHSAILDAAVALFVDKGFEGMSVEAVAAAAGVGKTTIYRRWRSKEELVLDAIAARFEEPSMPNTGNVRDDLVQSARELHLLMSSSATGAVFPRMGAEIAGRSRLGRLYGERVIAPRRAIFARALARGIERGELPKDTDVELAIDLVVGALLLRRFTGRLRRSDTSLPECLVATILTGLGTQDA
jgi:AcrR family transcriptional regulator